jgi:hypothetical protein
LPEIAETGRRVAVGTESPVKMCAGTLVAFDAHVDFVESELGLAERPSDPLEVYIVDDPGPWCDESVACYLGGWVDASVVPSSWARPVWHELVHQVVARSEVGMTDRFLSEGLASALGDDWCPPAPALDWKRAPLAALFAREKVEYDHYPVGARFVDFIRERYGTTALVDFARCVERGDPLEDIDRCAVGVLGDDLDGLSRVFEVADVGMHANPALCSGDATPVGAGLTLHTTLDCDAPGTTNTFDGPDARSTAYLVEIDEPGMFALQWSRPDDVSVEVEPCFCPAGLQPLRSQPDRGRLFFAEPGVHRLVLATDDPDVGDVELSLRRVDAR